MSCVPKHILAGRGESMREEGREIMEDKLDIITVRQALVAEVERDRERLRVINAKLLAALKDTAEKLHGLRNEPECLMHLFQNCPKSYCAEARDAIQEATE